MSLICRCLDTSHGVYACPWTDFQRFGVIDDLWASPVIAGNWALVAGLEQDVVAKPLGFDLRAALH